MPKPSKKSRDRDVRREQQRAYRKRVRERYDDVLTAALAANSNLPAELRTLPLLRPLARAVDDWIRVAVSLDIRGDVEGRATASKVSTILHAVTDAVLRGEYAQLERPALWADVYLREHQLAQPFSTRSVRERAVRDRVVQHLAGGGICDATPRFVVTAYMEQFPEEVSLYGDVLDLSQWVRDGLGATGSSRFHRTLGDGSPRHCNETAVALVRLLLRHPRWTADVSKNFLKADDVNAWRTRERRKRGPAQE